MATPAEIREWLITNEPAQGASDPEYDRVLNHYAQMQTNPLRSFEKQDPTDLSIAEVGRNLAPSAERMGVNMINAVTQPGQSAEVLSSLFSVDPAKEPFREAVRQDYSDAYGTWDKTKHTINTDPMRALGDASAAVTMGGGGLGLVGNLPKVGKIGTLGRGMQQVGVALDPVNLGINSLKLGAKGVSKLPGIKNIPNRLYQWATKMKTTADPKVRQKAVDLALKEGIEPTPDGIFKLEKKAQEVITKRDAILFDGGNADIEIPINNFYDDLDDLRKFYVDQPQRYGEDYARVLNKAESDIRRMMKRLGKDSMTLKEWKEFRTTLGKETNWRSTKQQGIMLDNEIDQSFYHTARKKLQGIDPRIKPLDTQYSEYMTLRELLTGTNSGNFAAGPVGRLGNKPPLDLKSVAMAGPAVASGDPRAMAAAGGYAIANEPSSMYGTAMRLHNLQNASPLQILNNNSPAWWLGRQGAQNIGNMQWQLPKKEDR